MPLLSDYNMELIWIILGWVTGGGKSLGTAMWLLVPRGQAWSGVVYQSTFLKHSISVKNRRIPHCLSQYLERSARKLETIPRMAALQSLHQRLAFQLTSQLSPTHHNPAPLPVSSAVAPKLHALPAPERFVRYCGTCAVSRQLRVQIWDRRHLLTDLCIPGEKGHAFQRGEQTSAHHQFVFLHTKLIAPFGFRLLGRKN